jgi:hypothetical protein
MLGSIYHGHRQDIDALHDTEVKPWAMEVDIMKVL